MSRTVLVTGVSRYLGGRMAALLAADPEVSTVIGVDVVAPEIAIPGTEFVRADIRNPVIAKVMGEAGVDTVVHMGVIATPKQAGGRSTMKEINVIGTMQLLAACQRTPSVRSASSITRVSSDSRSARTCVRPSARAASKSTRLEMLFDPGSVISPRAPERGPSVSRSTAPD